MQYYQKKKLNFCIARVWVLNVWPWQLWLVAIVTNERQWKSLEKLNVDLKRNCDFYVFALDMLVIPTVIHWAINPMIIEFMDLFCFVIVLPWFVVNFHSNLFVLQTLFWCVLLKRMTGTGKWPKVPIFVDKRSGHRQK